MSVALGVGGAPRYREPVLPLGLFLACLLIGVLAALMGLGGGLFVVPLLTLVTELSMEQAAGVSLICTLAASAGGSVALDKARLADLALVAELELAATAGAILGAYVLVQVVPERGAAGAFALIVAYAAWRMLGRRVTPPAPAAGEPCPPKGQRLGLIGFVLAGATSGLLGIGGGPVKVPVQTEVMHLPLRVALANSNIMVGITAGTGAAIYYARGEIPAALVGPCVLGIAVGAYLGGLLAPRVRARSLRYLFVVILTLVCVRMAWKAIAPAS